MTVSDLKKELSKHPDDLIIKHLCPDGYSDSIIKLEQEDGILECLGDVFINRVARKLNKSFYEVTQFDIDEELKSGGSNIHRH